MSACTDANRSTPNSSFDSVPRSPRLEALLEALAARSGAIPPGELAEMLVAAHLTAADVEPWISFEEDLYGRREIACLPHADLLVLSWRSGQLTPIHNHRGSACAFYVVRGISTEINYRETDSGLLAPSSSTRIAAGEVAASFDTDTHQMGNLERPGEDLVTVHCYSPPLTRMEFFGESQAFFRGYEPFLERSVKRMRSGS